VLYEEVFAGDQNDPDQVCVIVPLFGQVQIVPVGFNEHCTDFVLLTHEEPDWWNPVLQVIFITADLLSILDVPG
jgi:hypothetical protein